MMLYFKEGLVWGSPAAGYTGHVAGEERFILVCEQGLSC